MTFYGTSHIINTLQLEQHTYREEKMNEINTLAQSLIPVASTAFVAGVFLAVIIAAGRVAFKLAPFILALGAAAYFFGG